MKISPIIEQILFGVAVFISLIVAFRMPFIIQGFHENLKGFGAELNWLSAFIVNNNWLAWGLPVLTLLAWWCWPVKNFRSVASLLVAVGGAIIIYATSAFAMYLAISELGSVV